MPSHRVVVIGAGIGGLVAAVMLAAQGVGVTVVEKASAPGGKMREAEAGGQRIDAGPTVFTMLPVFEEVFAAAGTTLDAHLTLKPLSVLARHAWSERDRLDLFADLDRSADAIGAFAGPDEARRFLEFSRHARRTYETLDRSFIRASRPSVQALVGGAGMGGLGDLWRIRPFATMWQALGDHFRDPRLRQLFGRYATYCGSSPFAAPATLMLVAHVEQEGVWAIEGGMHRLAVALAEAARGLGVELRYGAEAAEVLVVGGRASGVRLAEGERLAADTVVANTDVNAVASGRLGSAVREAVAATPVPVRSLSAVTWAMTATTAGFPLSRHNVFFSADYPAEFEDIFRRRRLPSEPTVYVCAQDRDDSEAGPDGPERLLCLVNAPASGDTHPFDDREIEQCETRTFALLERCGLRVERNAAATVVTTPSGFERLFPATGGALYGRASHGWRASFDRPGVRSRLPGLYLTGGSTHPGPGVPMAALSGRMAAACLVSDLASTSRRRRTAMSGGTSTA